MGSVSADAPLAGVVSVKDSSEPAVERVSSIDQRSQFSVDVSTMKGPFLLKAGTKDGSAVVAVSSGGSTNINQFTSAVASGAAGGLQPAAVYEQASNGKTKETADNLESISTELRAALAPLFKAYGVDDPLNDTSVAGQAGLKALLHDVRITIVEAFTYVTNRETSALIYQGPSSNPSAGTFYAENMPTPPSTTTVDPVAPVSDPAAPGTPPTPTATATPAPTPTTTPTATPTPTPTVPTTCSYVYSSWSACQSTGKQTRTVVGLTPSGCTGTPIVSQSCTYVPPPCTYTYSSWGACQADGTQTRTIASATPTGCVGTPAVTQSCAYSAPVPAPVTTTSTSLFPPQTTMTKLTQPSVAEPPLYGSITNVFGSLGAEFNTKTTRVSDRPHHYAKDSPWNVDETMALTQGGYIIDGKTYQPLRNVAVSPYPNEHRTWSNTDPRYIYGAHKQNRQWIRVDATNPANNVVLATYSQYSTVEFGKYEGNIDNRDTSAVLIGNGNIPFIIDPKTGAVRCVITAKRYTTVYDTTMSQDGQYALVTYAGSLGPSIDTFDPQTCAFRRNLNPNWKIGHWDACVSTGGYQVVVANAADSGATLMMIRMVDGVTTPIYTGDRWIPGHISCRNTKRPGWAYNSIYNGTACSTDASAKLVYNRIWAVKLDGSQTVENYAWDRQACPAGSTDDNIYARIPVAAPSPSGTRVWFKGSWGVTDGPVHSYVAQK